MGSVAAMEVVEGQKRTEFLKLVDEGEEDRISALPDSLIVEILDRLPSMKYAIITGTLSKRWQHLWTGVHTLIFTQSDDPLTNNPSDPKIMSDFVSCVDKTITQCRQLKLKKFEVHTSYNCRDFDIRFESQLNSWIRFAVSCKIEELNLKFGRMEKPQCLLDQSIFISSYFTDLKLDSCLLSPNRAISWKNLRNLCISRVNIDEDLIENILFGSPLLETLELLDCYGYNRLDITSKSVKNLVFSGYYDLEDQMDLDDVIEINAPNILSLSIEGSLLLWKILLVNVSSLIQANLAYEKLGHFERTKRETREEMLKGLLLNLRHLKELNIGYLCCPDFSRLEAKGLTFPSTVNVEFPDGRPYWSDSDSEQE